MTSPRTSGIVSPFLDERQTRLRRDVERGVKELADALPVLGMRS